MKKLIFIFFLSSFCFGQGDKIIEDTIFLDVDWLETKSRNSAMYFRGAWFNSEDSVWLVHDYYLETNSIQMIGSYKNTIRPYNQTGEFNYYYKNGKIRANYYFDNGKMTGNASLFYPNGNPELIRQYKDGVQIDTVWSYYENGKLREIKYLNKNYDDSNPADAEKEFVVVSWWNEKGEQLISNGNGIKIENFPDGKKKQTIEYSLGFPHGEWVQYNEKKKVVSRMNFKNGKFISGTMYLGKRKKEVFATLHREPRFNGGIKALDEYVSKNTGKCKEAHSDEITLMINIDKEGNASFDQVLSGNVSHCQYEEIEQLVQKMPKWMPAIRYGQFVESTYVIRIRN